MVRRYIYLHVICCHLLSLCQVCLQRARDWVKLKPSIWLSRKYAYYYDVRFLLAYDGKKNWWIDFAFIHSGLAYFLMSWRNLNESRFNAHGGSINVVRKNCYSTLLMKRPKMILHRNGISWKFLNYSFQIFYMHENFLLIIDCIDFLVSIDLSVYGNISSRLLNPVVVD